MAALEGISVIIDGRSKLGGWPGDELIGLSKGLELARGLVRTLVERGELAQTEVVDPTREIWSGEWLSPWLHFHHDIGETVRFLVGELGWRPPRLSWPAGASNCRLALIDGYLCHRYSIPDNPYEHELSMEIRQGEISRGDALAKFEAAIDSAALESVVSELGLDLETL